MECEQECRGEVNFSSARRSNGTSDCTMEQRSMERKEGACRGMESA